MAVHLVVLEGSFVLDFAFGELVDAESFALVVLELAGVGCAVGVDVGAYEGE